MSFWVEFIWISKFYLLDINIRFLNMHKTALIDNDVDYRFHRLFKPGRGLIKDMKTKKALADNIYQVLAILSDSA